MPPLAGIAVSRCSAGFGRRTGLVGIGVGPRRRAPADQERVDARPSDVGFEGEGVAVRILEPRDTSTAGPSGDSLGVMF